MRRHRTRAHKAPLIEAGQPTLVLPPLQAAEQSGGRSDQELESLAGGDGLGDPGPGGRGEGRHRRGYPS